MGRPTGAAPLGDLHRIECWLLHHGLHLKVIRRWARRRRGITAVGGRASAAPVWSRLQGECMSCSAKPESKRRKPEVMLPNRLRRSICFRNSPGALVRFSFHFEIGESPRCCPVLSGLRDRCIAAMLATQDGSQWTCSTSCGCSSVRFPTGGGALVRFDFHESRGPGWTRTINLPSQNRALFYLSYRATRNGFGGWNRTNSLQLMRLTSDRCSSPGLKTILRPALPRHGPHYECGALLTSATEECFARKRLRK